MAESRRSLQLELQELLLVGLGAIPGALLRWQIAVHLADRNLLVNVFGAALLGLLAGLPVAPRRQLLVGIGFSVSDIGSIESSRAQAMGCCLGCFLCASGNKNGESSSSSDSCRICV